MVSTINADVQQLIKWKKAVCCFKATVVDLGLNAKYEGSQNTSKVVLA